MEKDDVLRKIKKLFDVANAKNIANQNEAEQALRIAQALMTQYNVQEYELFAGVVENLGKDIIGRYFIQQPRKLLEDKFICGIIIRFFNVRLVWKGRSDLYAVGTPTNLDIAENVFWYLRTIFRSLWLNYYYSLSCSEQSTSLKQPYYDGLRCGLSDRLESERIILNANTTVCTAIVAVNNALDKKYKEMFPHVRCGHFASFRNDSDTFNDGKRDSFQINLHKGVSGGHQQNVKKIVGSKITL